MNRQKIKTSLGLAILAHEGQARRFGPDKGKPYIVHPKRVAKRAKEIAANMGLSLEIQDKIEDLGYVHDVAEDSDDWEVLTLAKALKFGPLEEYSLSLLTKKEGVEYDEFILEIVEVAEARVQKKVWWLSAFYAAIVKYADLEDNSATATGSMKAKYKLSMYILKNHFNLKV